jgi:hypothetical protein
MPNIRLEWVKKSNFYIATLDDLSMKTASGLIQVTIQDGENIVACVCLYVHVCVCVCVCVCV